MTISDDIVPPLARALSARGYSELTAVQKAMLRPELRGADALVSAQTGSGKTVAFGIAIAPTLLDGAERFGPAATPLALAIAPTRELAMQLTRELEWLYAETGASVVSSVGGMDMRAERRLLERGAHIVVGTPGRLRDHIMRGGLDMTSLRAVVLDEADEMLDLGFREDLEFILDAAPPERRTLMFSATVPRAIATLAKSYQHNAVRIAAEGERQQHGDIGYQALTVAPGDQENAIINVLRFHEAPNALVFCATRAAVTHLTARFANRGFAVVALSGELTQNERTHALQAMRDGRARVCVATDVAARGIDLPNLDLVIHSDLPTNPETLLHRSGRTGRAGRKGISVMIVPNRARHKAERLLQSAKVAAEWGRPPSAEEIVRRDDQRILESPIFTDAVNDEERDLVRQLLERYDAPRLAAAIVRLSRAGRSAPEELIVDAAPAPTRGTEDRDFGASAWFSLSVGRKQNAEPRWVLPMLCRAGKITRTAIGAIRIREEETFVQLAEPTVGSFLAAIGPKRMLENGVRVTRLDRAPDLREAAEPGRPHRPAADRPKTFAKKPWGKKPDKSRAAADAPRKPKRKPKG